MEHQHRKSGKSCCLCAKNPFPKRDHFCALFQRLIYFFFLKTAFRSDIDSHRLPRKYRSDHPLRFFHSFRQFIRQKHSVQPLGVCKRLPVG